MDAYQYSLRLLSKRDYPEKKLREKLYQKKFLDADIDSAVKKLLEMNYLREEEYARARIQGYLRKGYSAKFIKSKLSSEVSFEPELIKDVQSGMNFDTRSSLQGLIQKKTKGVDIAKLPFEEKQKALLKVKRFLFSKGYGFDEINGALKIYGDEFTAD